MTWIINASLMCSVMPVKRWHAPSDQNLVYLLVLVSLLLSSSIAFAHEPLFSIGPQTIYKGGIGLETEVETERKKGAGKEEEEWRIVEEIAYGVTRNLTLTLQIPYRFRDAEGPTGNRASNGFGDISTRGKFRIYHWAEIGLQRHVSLVGGVKFPTGSTSGSVALGSGSTDFLVGGAASQDGRRYYAWTSLVYRINTEGWQGRTNGNLLQASVAGGVRPYLPEFYDPDLLLLVELNSQFRQRDTGKISDRQNTGGNSLFISPGFWLTYRNWALKGGVQIPVLQDLNGRQPELDYRALLAVEYHF